jgi:hypothetical protein
MTTETEIPFKPKHSLVPVPSKRSFVDRTGCIYGSLTVVGYMGMEGRSIARWLCMCACGEESVVNGSNLKSGSTKSCGCQRNKFNRVTHGLSKTAEYRVWRGMLTRCGNPKDHTYHNYGGRGITVCERWLKFKNFSADMGRRPSKDHSIDRINNNGNYEPENCRWATIAEQRSNQRTNTLLTYQGRTQIMKAWASELGILPSTLRERLVRGWTTERALSTAPRRYVGRP